MRTGGPLVVVDDTVYGGAAMRRARAAMGGQPAVYAAVYVRPQARGAVDLAGVDLPCPHLLEWNLLNCGVAWGNAANPIFRRGVAVDLDGIILHDSDSGGDVGGPYLVPRMRPIPLICTGRPETARAQTEAQLRQWGAKWARLEMYPGGRIPDVLTVAAYKAKHYAASGCGFFLESDPIQAAEIHRLSRMPVVCPRVGKVWQ